MPNLSNALNEQIKKLTRREIKAQLESIKKAVAQNRADIAVLKRQLGEIEKAVDRVARRTAASKLNGSSMLFANGDDDSDPQSQGNRFRADGLRTHRAKLELSALDYGKLIGVSALTIYSYESGKSRPRPAQLAKLVAIRGIGKREALQRLESGMES